MLGGFLFGWILMEWLEVEDEETDCKYDGKLVGIAEISIIIEAEGKIKDGKQDK